VDFVFSIRPSCLSLLKGVSRCCPHTASWSWRGPHPHQRKSAGKAPLATACALFQTVQWNSSRVGLKCEVVCVVMLGRREGRLLELPLSSHCQVLGYGMKYALCGQSHTTICM